MILIFWEENNYFIYIYFFLPILYLNSMVVVKINFKAKEFFF